MIIELKGSTLSRSHAPRGNAGFPRCGVLTLHNPRDAARHKLRSHAARGNETKKFPLFSSRASLYNIRGHISDDAGDNQTSQGHVLVFRFGADQPADEHMYREARYDQRTNRGNQINEYLNDHVLCSRFLRGRGGREALDFNDYPAFFQDNGFEFSRIRRGDIMRERAIYRIARIEYQIVDAPQHREQRFTFLGGRRQWQCIASAGQHGQSGPLTRDTKRLFVCGILTGLVI